MNAGDTGPTSWAAATWSVPTAVVAWLATSLVIGLVVPDLGERSFFGITAAVAVAMTVVGRVVSRRGDAVVRGLGLGLLHAGPGCALVAIVAVVR